MTGLASLPEEVRVKAREIVRLGDGMSPQLFVAALAVAAGASIASSFREEDHETAAQAHYHGVVDTMRTISGGTARQ